MAKRDYYEILSVPRNASAEDIKKAYRKSALAHHPDRNPGDKKAEDKFKEATEAYQVLSNDQKRQLYDQYGHAGVDSQGMGGGGFSGAGFGDIFEDIFEDFFGGSTGRRRNRAQKGSDLGVAVELDFEEAATGVQKTVEVRREEDCTVCKGDGAKPGTERKTCNVCHGSGQVMASSGFFSISRPCHRCQGRGVVIEHPCAPCRGTGRVAVSRQVQARIPAGVDTGVRLRLGGEGEAGHYGGPRGDLYIEIHVREHELFGREGDDVICIVPISMVQAALGCELEVPTLTGPSKLKIPAGTQNGKSFKLKGKGFTSIRGAGTGDQECRIVVETPSHLSEEQAGLLRRFAELSGDKVNPATQSLRSKSAGKAKTPAAAIKAAVVTEMIRLRMGCPFS